MIRNLNLIIRPSTDDIFYYDKVLNLNSYKLKPLPPIEEPTDRIVVDIGAHVGYFTVAAFAAGYNRFYCIEANIENFLILAQNVRDFSERVSLYNNLVAPNSSEFFCPIYDAKVLDGAMRIYGRLNLDKLSINYHKVALMGTEEVPRLVSQKIDLLKISLGDKISTLDYIENDWLKNVENLIVELGDCTLEEIKSHKDVLAAYGFIDFKIVNSDYEEGYQGEKFNFIFCASREKCDKVVEIEDYKLKDLI